MDNNELRTINNKIRELEIKMTNVKADMKKLVREREAFEMKKRVLDKEIRQLRLNRDLLIKDSEKFQKQEFALNADFRLVKKQLEELLAQRRAMGGF